MDDTREVQSAELDSATFEEDRVLEQRDGVDENFNALLDGTHAFRRDDHTSLVLYVIATMEKRHKLENIDTKIKRTTSEPIPGQKVSTEKEMQDLVTTKVVQQCQCVRKTSYVIICC